MRAEVVEGDVVFHRERPHGVADLVAEVVLQPALADVQHLVELGGDVEPKATNFHRAAFVTYFHVLFGKPPLVCEGVFQLVAVEILFLGGKDRLGFGVVEMTEVAEVVGHLFLLVKKLFLVIEHLPFTAAAQAEVSASRLHAVGRRLHNPRAAGFRIRFFLLENHHIDNVAWHDACHENGHSIVLCHGFSFRAGINYFQILYGVLFVSHLFKIGLQK